MARTLGVGALVCAVFVLAGCGGDSGAYELRVCGEPAFDPTSGLCTRDESGRLLRGDTFFCSAKLGGDQAVRPAAQLFYEGADFPQIRGDRGARVAWIVAHAGGLELPGGSWRCRFSLGDKRAEIAFRSAGSRDEVLHAAVCRADRLVQRVPIPACADDESGDTIADPITCSAVFLNGQGAMAHGELLDSAGNVYSEYSETLDGPVAAFSVLFEHVEQGDYRCRFRTERGASASVSFSVAGSRMPGDEDPRRYDDRELPRRGWSRGESVIEPLLTDVARELTGIEVQVRCWSRADWSFLTTDDYVGAASGYANFPDAKINLAPETCDDLATLAYTKRRFWGGEMRLYLAYSVGVLAHETAHFGRAGGNEGVAECYGVQRLTRTAELLGAPAPYAAGLASLYWREHYPDNPPAYRARGCRPGGTLDLDPERAGWP